MTRMQKIHWWILFLGAIGAAIWYCNAQSTRTISTNDNYLIHYYSNEQPNLHVNWQIGLAGDASMIHLRIENLTPSTNRYELDSHGTNLIVFVSDGWRPVVVKSNDEWAIVFEEAK